MVFVWVYLLWWCLGFFHKMNQKVKAFIEILEKVGRLRLVQALVKWLLPFKTYLIQAFVLFLSAFFFLNFISLPSSNFSQRS